jgi:hypothetical protein
MYRLPLSPFRPQGNRTAHKTCLSCGYRTDWSPYCEQCRWYLRLAAVVFSKPRSCS